MFSDYFYEEIDDHLIWEGASIVSDIINRGLRNQFVDALPEGVRADLFDGYVLKEHYDALEKKLWIAKNNWAIHTSVVDKDSF